MNTCDRRAGGDLLRARQELARAEEDYQRLRTAYLEMAKTERNNEVGLAMIGADMDRAYAHLQLLAGLPRLPFTAVPTAVLLWQLERTAGENA